MMAIVKESHLLVVLVIWIIVWCFTVFNPILVPFDLKQHGQMQIGRRTRRGQDFHSTKTKRTILTFKDAPECTAIHPTVLLYNRIFKTGSTSMTCIINSVKHSMNFAMDFATTEDWYDKRRKPLYPNLLTRHARRALTQTNHTRFVFIAHFYFRSRLKRLHYSHTYINQVRDPVRRVISHYFYLHRSQERPLNRIRKMKKSGFINETLEECLAKQHPGCESNLMTRFFCGKHSFCRSGSNKALSKAKHNISRYYASVGLLEHFSLYLRVLNKRLPEFVSVVDNLQAKKVNRFYNESKISKKTIQVIRKMNSADIKLYEYIQKRFWRQVKACGLLNTI
ncbi:uronyl 2-sulfotransferase isoform X2 [Nematostella vectensis]|nr:uronyl 2-sulfotransferase isoform X2 [Nematostella vectensis]XP_032240183.2 uronyl 2-sulfotransferase isoform X2 [Nematostella vectensis]